MKQIINFAAFFLITVFVFCSCKKEKIINTLPYANAGVDQIITLPADSIVLKGSGKVKDGDIGSYHWSKILGPSSFTILDPNNAETKIKSLIQGEYLFELKVTDNSGFSAKDIVKVIVDFKKLETNIKLIPVGILSITRDYSAAATSGNKLLFAGGGYLSSRVDIYDMSTQIWSTAELSEARTGIGAITIGDKILFAGGAKNFNYDDGWHNLSTRIDIYDASKNSWAITELPTPINFLWWEGAVAAAGSKAFFCGNRQDTVYIFDVNNNSWSTAPLSYNYIGNLAATSVGNKILIASGESNKVDIYDASANTWKVDSLSQVRGLLRAASLNTKAFFAGGVGTNIVDIYDITTQSWSVSRLSRPSGLQSTVLSGGAASIGQKILFFGGALVDTYDTISNSWSISEISQVFDDGSTIIAAGGNIYATNGKEVWMIQL